MSDRGIDSNPATSGGRPLRVLLAASAVVIILAALHGAATLVVPIVVAVLIAVIMGPYEHQLIARGWPRLAAFGVVLAITVIGLVAIVIAVDVSLSAFIVDLPAYRPGSERLLQDVLDLGARAGLDLSHLVHVSSAIRNAFSAADTLTRSLLATFAGWTVVLILTVFMLYEALDFPEKVRGILGQSRHVKRLGDFARDLSRFMRLMTLGAALTAAGDLVVMVALGVPSAVLWAGLAFLFSYIPSIGYIMIVIPPTIATLVRFGFGRALVVLVGLTLIDNAVGIILLPRLIGRRLDVAPFWGMLSLVVWGWLLGPAGAILAIPLTMFAKFLLDSSPSTEPLGRLVAPLDRPGPRKDRGRRIVGQA